MAEPKLEISYVDLANVSETFADSVEKINIDGNVWRFEFCATRMEEPKPEKNVIPGKKYPVCRLVLTNNCGLDLFNKLRRLVEIMEKQGMVKTTQAQGIPPNVKPS